MKYKIISDTSCDLTKEMQEKINLSYVPFKITVDSKEFIDDDNLNVRELIDTMVASDNPIKTACPSPFEYLKVFKEAEEDNIFVVTISQKLSGSYNSAKVAEEEFKKEFPNKKIYIADSKSASAGQTSVVYKLVKILENEEDFENAIEKINKTVDDNKTFFILESLENLIKNGRIKKTTGLIANILNIRPIMEEIDGEIALFEMNRGFTRSLSKLANALGNICDNMEERVLFISHVAGLEKAKFFKEKVEKLYDFKDIIIIHTKGLASGYADNGGIVIGF
ncbi:putative DegV family protein [Peptoniphilus sp. ING2-D1G]|nr:putative DegV family protein [Peptoniphilus sp. ING2-D1G]